MDLLEQFQNYIKDGQLFQKKDRLLLAVSGGLDSVVLCAACRACGFDFEIAHCNFHLRGTESERDADFVEALGHKYAVKTFIKHFDTIAVAAQQKTSIEETARNLRYSWFAELLSTASENPLKYILTAHHADDNIETVLMNFFRGTGINGLRGIVPKQAQLVRPLLFARRKELEDFATGKGLEYVTDSSNASNDYTRNYFRNELLPAIAKVYPEAKENVLRNISRFTDVALLYRQAVDQQLKKLVEKKGNELHIPVLKLEKLQERSTLIYEIIKAYGFTSLQVDEVLALLQSETGKYVQSATHQVIKNRNWLILAPKGEQQENFFIIETANGTLDFGNNKLSWAIQPWENSNKLSDSALIAILDSNLIKLPLVLRRWKAGDYFYPLGMQKKKKLSRFLGDQKLSLNQKENIWVLEMDKKIIWVVGLRIDDRFKVRPSTASVIRFSLIP